MTWVGEAAGAGARPERPASVHPADARAPGLGRPERPASCPSGGRPGEAAAPGAVSLGRAAPRLAC
ncbi:hypothetical protein [Sorangium sp. So ce363]|uniref:hypothetical protein n=1 Tax=Sorangium sp. So ce363 TaxID=3133304 RepID=UPI003F61B765